MLDTAADAEIRAVAEGYCRALHTADADALEALCHDGFFMTTVQPDGAQHVFDKERFVSRARARSPFDGEPSYEILAIDVEAPEMAHVKLWVDMPPRRFHDFLGFLRIGGEWTLVTKLFRTASGPSI
ncbi:MAG: nuclear transport factor 2 family protein [Pseudomonadota bacterium]